MRRSLATCPTVTSLSGCRRASRQGMLARRRGARPQDLLPRRLLRWHDVGRIVLGVLSRRDRPKRVGAAGRDGPPRRRPVRGRGARWRRPCLRGLSVLRRSEDALVVRSPPDGVPAAGAARGVRARAPADLVLRSNGPVVRGADLAGARDWLGL